MTGSHEQLPSEYTDDTIEQAPYSAITPTELKDVSR